MMGTNIDLKVISRKVQRLTLIRFYRLNKCREIGCSRLVMLSSGSFKTNFSTQYNICKSSSLLDQWSDYCTITSIKSKIYIHNSFSGKAAQPTFQTGNEIHSHFVIFGRIIQRLEKLLAFLLLLCGSFKIDISTCITSVKVIVLKISGQTFAL